VGTDRAYSAKNPETHMVRAEQAGSLSYFRPSLDAPKSLSYSRLSLDAPPEGLGAAFFDGRGFSDGYSNPDDCRSRRMGGNGV
jgi:hypothetical protein